MMPKLDPCDEAARLEALARYAILDTGPEPGFDDIARLASHLCGTPISLVSLVDAGRQWFKARVGLRESETPLADSFCHHAIRHLGLFVVTDAAADPRFIANPLVAGPPGIRFYAGTPLLTPDGFALGTLCVIDRVPRQLAAAQAEALEALGRQVADQLELRRALADARASRARVSAVLKSASDAIATLDRVGVILDVNAAGERIFGRPRREMIGLSLGELASPASPGDLAPPLAIGPGGAPGGRSEVLAMRRGGDAFPAEITSTAIVGGGPASRVVQIRDITERKRDEAISRRLAAVVESSEDAIITKDLDGVINGWNAGAARLFGHAEADAVGRHISFLIPPEHHADMDLILARIRRGERVEHFETRRLARDGRILDVSLSVSPIRDGEGRIVGAAKVARDIGARKRAEEELRRAHDELEDRVRARTAELAAQAETLRRAEEDYRGIFENAVEGIYQSSPGGYYLKVNPALARIFGYDGPDELVAALSDIGHQLYVEPGRREEFRRLVGEHGSVAGFESRVRRRDGGVIWIRENARAVRGPGGEILHYEGFVEDITERRLAEAEIRGLNRDLEQAYDATIEGWARALDLRDRETEGHSRRVTEMSLRLGRAMGLGEGELVHVRRGALLHDIGKLGVPDAVLLKPGRLSEAEWEVMRRHPTYAHDWLATIPVLGPALAIPHGHHERWDGAGYPRGLAGEEIPLAARLFAAVDIWDALRSDRPYRRAWPEARVREHLRSLAGGHLDPSVVDAFLRLLEEMDGPVLIGAEPTTPAERGPRGEPIGPRLRADPGPGSGQCRAAGGGTHRRSDRLAGPKAPRAAR